MSMLIIDRYDDFADNYEDKTNIKITRDSSVGRAEDCSWYFKLSSLGHWFESGSRDFFLFNSISCSTCSLLLFEIYSSV